jgi:hypothetical protein
MRNLGYNLRKASIEVKWAVLVVNTTNTETAVYIPNKRDIWGAA